jgi:pimeloyl-ACP methyl ester carboxylesterase
MRARSVRLSRTTLAVTGSLLAAILWPPPFLRALSGAGYRIIRFDQRGTGASDWMPGWSRAHPYTLVDMARDAIAVLDATGTERAHLIGLSYGGMVAQEVAILQPHRVASLTLMSTSPDPTDPTLPEPRSGDWRFVPSAACRC